MKKYIVLALCALSASQISAYALKARNATDGEVIVAFFYAGGDLICPSKGTHLKPGQTATIQSGACCTKVVLLRSTSGSSVGQTTKYYPPVTGFGIACRNFQFVIKQSADKGIIAETESDLHGRTITVTNKTNGEISFNIYYTGGGWCGPAERIVPQGGTVHVSAGLCCTDEIRFFMRNGPSKGKSYFLIPPRRGIGETCASMGVTVSNLKDGNIIAEANLR